MNGFERQQIARIIDLTARKPIRASLSQIRTTNARGIEDHVAQVNDRAEEVERNLELIAALAAAL